MSRPTITFCMGSSCFARGNERNLAACEAFLAARGMRDEVDVVLSASLCTGNCSDGPVVTVNDEVHRHVDVHSMDAILATLFPA